MKNVPKLSKPMPLFLLLLLSVQSAIVANAYCSSDIHRRDMAGIWRFQGQFRPKKITNMNNQKKRYPMKEFTVYPKKETSLSKKKEDNFLLKLSEDGSFEQTSSDDDASSKNKKKKRASMLRGTWDFVDGKLILAAERAKDTDGGDMIGGEKDHKPAPDTILVGEVVATAEQKLKDNPALNADSSSSSSSSSYDVYLSVPNGLVEVGKFTYPRHHPSFFDQPIFRPKPTGSFQLQQVLGSLNTKQEEKPPVHKFHKHHFVDKKFFLTSHPIQPKKPKGRKRWSIKYNKFVYDAPPPSKEQEKEMNNPQQQKINIRVMEVQFFGNNTFATTAGLGSAAILRGKWSIIGEEKDHLWMQVYRFGFGRSVSGSVYSEGRGLTHNDEKAYWGQIKKVNDENDDNNNNDNDNTNQEKDAAATSSSSSSSSNLQNTNEQQEATTKTEAIEVKGSVLDGWGLEPLPVARFTMVEKTEEEEYDDDDEEDEDEDEGGLIQDELDRHFNMNNEDEDSDDRNDPFSSLDAFQ